MTYREIKINDEAHFTKTITETDISFYSAISGDFNPIHVNMEYAKKSKFKKIVAHGGIALSFVAPIIGNKLPGDGSIFLGLDVKFKKPVYIHDTITCTVKVTSKIERLKMVMLNVKWTNQNDEVVIKGFCKALPRS